jgi:D-glycero-D-manno-heptose 1,7-bisphosphate phosphatase
MQNEKQLRPAVFLDRDGVVVHEKEHMTRPEQLELIPGAAHVIHRLNTTGIPVIIITNQSVVARNMCNEHDVERMHDHLQNLLMHHSAHIDAFFTCNHYDPAQVKRGEAQRFNLQYVRNCDCRKPKPGMLLAAAKQYHLDLRKSFMIGDKISDILAGKRAGCTTILVQTGYGGAHNQHAQADHVLPSILEARSLILESVLNERRTAQREA